MQLITDSYGILEFIKLLLKENKDELSIWRLSSSFIEFSKLFENSL